MLFNQFLNHAENIKYHLLGKGGSVEETLVYKFSPYRKFEFSHQRTESQAFVLAFCKEDNGVPHCKTLAQLTPSDSKTEKDSS